LDLEAFEQDRGKVDLVYNRSYSAVQHFNPDRTTIDAPLINASITILPSTAKDSIFFTK